MKKLFIFLPLILIFSACSWMPWIQQEAKKELPVIEKDAKGIVNDVVKDMNETAPMLGADIPLLPPVNTPTETLPCEKPDAVQN